MEQQSTGIGDQGTKTEELPYQIVVNPEVGQCDEALLEPKSDIETLMVTNMNAKSNDSGAQPTSSNNTKLNSTPSKTKAATQGKPNNSTKRDQGENHSSSKRVTRSSIRQASHEKDPEWKPGPGRVTVETSENLKHDPLPATRILSNLTHLSNNPQKTAGTMFLETRQMIFDNISRTREK